MNVTTVTIQGCHSQMRYTSTLFQYDYGQILKIEGVELPDTFQAHFCNVSDTSTKTVLGSDNQVSIPDEYLDTGEDILCYIYLHTGEDDGETEYKIFIPVTARQSITNEEPTPEQQSEIDQLIIALNDGVSRAETAAANAETSETNAKTSEDNAKESELNAKASEDAVEASAVRAETAAASAEASASSASQSATNASASATLAESWAVGGTGTRQGEDTNNSKFYAESAISAKDEAVLAKTQAESARDLSVQAKESAQASAQTATQKASEATQSATSASQSASSASASSTSASQSAALATSAKEAAQIAQGLAEDAKDEAVTAKEEAETAQQEAEAAAQSIAQSASQIAQNTEDISDLKSAIDFSLGIEKPLNYSTGTAVNASISPSANVWNVASNVMGYIIPLSQVSEITIKSNATNGSIFAFLKTDTHVHHTTPDYATGSGRTYIAADTMQTVIVPNDANYIYITDHLANNVSYLPQSVMLSTYIDANTVIEEIEAKTSACMDIDVSKYPRTNRYISPSANVWAFNAGVVAYMVPVPNQSLTFAIKGNEQNGSVVAILADDDTTLNTTPVYATGYTSRLFVPAGEAKDYTLPSDTRYIWIFMANATTDFSPVYTKVNYYVTFSDIENDLTVLKSYHPNYSGKKLSILGDSISTFAVPSEKTDGKATEGCETNYPGNPVQYSNSDVTSISATWWGRVLNQFGMVLGINESWAGSTIGYNPNQTSGGKYTADNCLCSATRIGHLGENGTPDIIIVFGGTNDINHHRVSSGSTIRYAVGSLDSEHNPYDFDSFPMVTETYYGSITTMLLRIQHTYPNATILMLLPYFCTYTHTSNGDIATPYDQNEWSKAAIDVCKYLGVEYLDLRSIINLYDVSSLLFDGLHPKANGMEAIAKAVIYKLNNML